MALLSPPFVLCPLSESKELLGIAQDRLENRTIITIGKNIAIRYHVIEQKQEVSWTSSRHWLTSKVVFCSDLQKYGAVIDNDVIALWEEDDAHLASIKKYKFGEPIFELRPTQAFGTLVIFKNGAVRSLVQGKSDKADFLKDSVVDEKLEKIIVTSIDEKTGSLFIVCGNRSVQKPNFKCGAEKFKKLKILSVKLESTDSKITTSIIQTTEITAALDDDLLSSCVIIDGNNTFLVYLSSDGYLYRRRLLPTKDSSESSEPSKIALLTNYVSCSNPVVIKSLDTSTIVLYGCDPSEEGATVFIFDINYDLVLSKQSLKLYGSPPIMEKVGLNIFVPVGLNILVLGLRITKSTLSAVLGRHQLQSVDFFENRQPWAKAWDDDDAGGLDLEEESNTEDEAVSVVGFKELIKLVSTLENNGQPQSMICSQVIPDIIERRNFGALTWLLNYFTDIPEIDIIHILTLLLSSTTEESNTNGDSMSIDEDEAPTPSGKKQGVLVYHHSKEIHQILQRPFDQKQMIRSLRSMNFQVAKKLLHYISDRLEASWNLHLEDEDCRTEVSQMLKWASTVLDAHYPQFVFNNEMDTIQTMLTLIEDKSQVMSAIESLEPLLSLTLSRTSFVPGPSPNSKFRTEIAQFE